MAEGGCLRDIAVDNLEVKGVLRTSEGGKMSVRYMDYLAFNKSNLTATGVTINQAAGVAAVTADHTTDPTPADITAATCVANAVNTFSGDGAAATEIYLPPAVEGTHVCLLISGDIDQTGAVAIRCAPAGSDTAGTDRYASLFTISAHILNTAAAVIPTGCVSAIRTADSLATTELIYTAVAANTNFLGANSEIHFYCPTAGQWIAKMFAVPEGAGATGALSVGATALA